MNDSLYPVFLKLAGRPILVVGAGKVARRKIESLLKCGADVTVVAPEVVEKVQKLANDGKITLMKREFADTDLDDVMLVVAATSDIKVNKCVSDLARKSRIFVNAVDMPDLCDFYVPAVVDRSPLQIAISTAGSAPAFARNLRMKLEKEIPAELSGYINLLGDLREQMRLRAPDLIRQAAENMVKSEAISIWLKDGKIEAEKLLKVELNKLLEDRIANGEDIEPID